MSGLLLGGRCCFFLFFLLAGGERGSPRLQEEGGGVGLLLRIPGGGGFSQERGGQQLTYGVVSEGVFAESLRKFCGNSAESSQRTTFYCARKGCGNSAESLRKFHGNLRKIFCNDPFPNDPISVLLRWGDRGAERVSAGILGGGGGAKYLFFSGPICPPSLKQVARKSTMEVTILDRY